MLAVVFDRPGGPEVLTPRSVRLPAPRPDEVLVEVRAAGVNFVDTLWRDPNRTDRPTGQTLWQQEERNQA